jgi:hypothetical protein
VKKKAVKKVSKKAVKKKTSKKTKEIIPQVIEEKNTKKKTIKKKKQNPLKQKNVLIIIILAIIVIISLFISTAVLTSPCGLSKFSFSIQGISYCSNTHTPSTFFGEFVKNEMVYVSPILDEIGADQLTVNALNLWQVVLIGNDINVTQLLRVRVDDQISYCYTNRGDVKTAEKITLQECNEILNDVNTAVVMLQEGSEKVVMRGKKIFIYSSTSKVVGQVNFAIIKQIFPNAQSVLDIVNEKIYGI